MFRTTTVVVAVCALLCSLAPAYAGGQGDDTSAPKPFVISAGAFVATDVPVGEDADLGYSFALGAVLKTTPYGDWMFSTRFSRYTLQDGPTITLWNPLIEYRAPIGADKKLWISPGVGAVLGHASDGAGNTASFSYNLGIGYKVMDQVFVEARLARGTKRGEHGFIFSIGGRF